MRKQLVFVIIATILLLTGIVGAIFTFPDMDRNMQMTEEIIIQESISNIDIKSTHAKISILPTNEPEIKVSFKYSSDNEKLITEVKDTTLSIQVKNNFWDFINLNFFKKISSVVVYLPENNYKSLKANSSNGSIKIEDVNINDINMKSSNGKLQLNDVTADAINMNGFNGSIVLDHVHAKQTNFKTSNGAVRVKYVQGEINGSTKNGSVTFLTDEFTSPVSLQTSNGKIKALTETEPNDVMFDLRSSNGKVRVFGESDWIPSIGNGKNIIQLRSSNGSITVDYAD